MSAPGHEANAAGHEANAPGAGAGFDADAHREASARGWEEAASGWVRSQDMVREFGAPVSRWLIEAIAPAPGQRVLELCAGLGETGLAAAELVGSSGGVIVSDQAEAMLAGARERAAALGARNVEFTRLNAEWIDLPVASVDAVLCRWGYMLVADPLAAITETRRVLRPGGRVALAVWDAIEHNPWARLPALELSERGLVAAPAPGTPGPFTLGDSGRLAALLEQAGFAEVHVERLELCRRHVSFEDLWDSTLDLSRSFHDAVMARPQGEIDELRASLAARFQPFTVAGAVLEIPARTLVASATA
jgi:SAM-dependent methyltransferase